MKSILLFVALLSTIAFADIWTNCGNANDDLTIASVTISPDPPVIGQNLTITAKGTLSKVVTGGNVYVQLTYGGFVPLLNNSFDLCELLNQEAHQSCPVSKGPLSWVVSQPIPSIAPSGSYAGKIVVTDQSGDEITCIALNFSMGQESRKRPHKPFKFVKDF